MEKLTHNECLSLIQVMHEGALTIGFQKSIIAFGQVDSKPPNQCARSIVHFFSDGKDFQTSISEADPRIPRTVTRIITAGYLDSRLDYALGDIKEALVKTKNQLVLEEDLRTIEEKYNQYSTSEICQGCFEREMKQLISQAQSMKAATVELRQLGDPSLNRHSLEQIRLIL